MKLTIFKIKLAFDQQNREKIKKKGNTLLSLWRILALYSVLHRMRLIGSAHSFQFMERDHSSITTFKHAICAPNVFLFLFKLPENQISTTFVYVTFSNFLTISHINY